MSTYFLKNNYFFTPDKVLYAKNADTVPKNRKRPSFWNRRFGD